MTALTQTLQPETNLVGVESKRYWGAEAPRLTSLVWDDMLAVKALRIIKQLCQQPWLKQTEAMKAPQFSAATPRVYNGIWWANLSFPGASSHFSICLLFTERLTKALVNTLSVTVPKMPFSYELQTPTKISLF